MDQNTHEKELNDANILKEKGNECIKCHQYKEAVLCYTQAIKIESLNELLYSNRSLAYLKLHQFELALEDANEVIKLKPNWAKGYYRKAEVEFSIGLFNNALASYRTALQFLPDDPSILDAISKVNNTLKKKNETQDKLPWLCSCIGLILGVILTILDYTIAKEPILTNPLLQVVFIQIVAAGFWLVAYLLLGRKNQLKSFVQYEEGRSRLYLLIGLVIGGLLVITDATLYKFLDLKGSAGRIFFTFIFAVFGWGIDSLIYLKNKRRSDDLSMNKKVKDDPVEDNSIPERMSNKYTKAQARYRYKKGKM